MAETCKSTFHFDSIARNNFNLRLQSVILGKRASSSRRVENFGTQTRNDAVCGHIAPTVEAFVLYLKAISFRITTVAVLKRLRVVLNYISGLGAHGRHCNVHASC